MGVIVLEGFGCLLKVFEVYGFSFPETLVKTLPKNLVKTCPKIRTEIKKIEKRSKKSLC
jgi:hypothetical protein